MIDLSAAPLITGFQQGIAPPSRLPCPDWCAEFVQLPFSKRSGRFDISGSPWLRDPMVEATDNSNNEIVLVGPTGCGKTTLYEGLIAFIVAEDPGHLMFAAQSDQQAKLWAETRLHLLLKTCRPIQALWPRDRHKKRTLDIIFAHMPLSIGGPGMNRLQGPSIRYGLGDEVWKWQTGRMDEFRKRTHDGWNTRMFFASQAGTSARDSEDEEGEDTGWTEETGGPDLDAAFRLTDQREFSFACPECAEVQPWKWDQVLYEPKKVGETNQFDWPAIEKTVSYQCPHCEKKFPDTPTSRRSLAAAGRYVPTNPHAMPGHVGFHLNALAVWWIPWFSLVKEWILAQDKKTRGNLTPLRQFIQKRLAEPWKDDLGANPIEFKPGGYSLSEYAHGEPIENERTRIMSVDVQKEPYRHFWASIRAFRYDGTSRLLWEGKVISWDNLAVLAEEMKIRPAEGFQWDKRMRCSRWTKPANVYIDGNFEPEEVAQNCAQQGWQMVFGIDGQKLFAHPARKGREASKEPFGRIEFRKTRITKEGKALSVGVPGMKFAGDPMKDILTILIGNGMHEVADDVSEDFHKHMGAEIKKNVNRGTKVIRTYVKTRRDNHLRDTEVQTIAVARAGELLQGFSMEGEE